MRIERRKNNGDLDSSRSSVDNLFHSIEYYDNRGVLRRQNEHYQLGNSGCPIRYLRRMGLAH